MVSAVSKLLDTDNPRLGLSASMFADLFSPPFVSIPFVSVGVVVVEVLLVLLTSVGVVFIRVKNVSILVVDKNLGRIIRSNGGS